MPIPANVVLKNGHYIKDSNPGRPFWGCNCGGTPPDQTLRHINVNRGAYSTWPTPAAKPPEKTNENTQRPV